MGGGSTIDLRAGESDFPRVIASQFSFPGTPCLIVSPHMAQSIAHSMQSISKLQSQIQSTQVPIPTHLHCLQTRNCLTQTKLSFTLDLISHPSQPTTTPAVPIASFRPLLNHRPLLSPGLHPLPASQSIPVPPVRMRKSRPPLLESRTRKHRRRRNCKHRPEESKQEERRSEFIALGCI